MAEEDLIFGKNRHFFGGIEPSNMLEFSVTSENGVVTLTATLPNDTVINEQTLCTVEGAVIRRKETDYPSDEFDGDLIANIKSSTSFVDTTATATNTYYYTAFPYTTQGVYNRNKANRIVLNEPDPMITFMATSVYVEETNTAVVELTASLPTNVVGAIIRKSSIAYPTTTSEGDLVVDITSDRTYTDTDVVEGSIYYYTAFPYASNGAYNRSETNRASVIPKKGFDYIFGYDLVTSTSNPSNRVTYPSNVDNASFTPAAMNFITSTFDYGGWNIAPGKKFMPRPCMLSYSGTVNYYLNPDNYYLKVNGSNSDITDTSFGGNAMMEWPKIYTKRWVEDGVYHFRCSDISHGDGWDCWSNYDSKNNQIDHFYTPIYSGCTISGQSATGTVTRLRSISGQTSKTTIGIKDAYSYALNNGSDWCVEELADRLLINDLLVMMAKSTDCQAAYGHGRCGSSNTNIVESGTLDTKGMFWGYDDQIIGVKVFGMENYWGNLDRWIAGWIIENGTQKVKITRGRHDGSTQSGYGLNPTGDPSTNTSTSGYILVNYATPSGTAGGYIDTMKIESYGRIPVTTNGSSTTYEADCMLYKSSTDKKFAMVGGYYKDGYSAGPFNAKFNTVNTSSAFGGASLSYKPSAS